MTAPTSSPDAGPDADLAPYTRAEKAVLLIIYALSIGLSFSLLGWLWARWGDVLRAFVAAAWGALTGAGA